MSRFECLVRAGGGVVEVVMCVCDLVVYGSGQSRVMHRD